MNHHQTKPSPVCRPPPPVSGQLTVGRPGASQAEGGEDGGPVEQRGGQQEADQAAGVPVQEVEDGGVAALQVEPGPGLLFPADPGGGGGAAGVRQSVRMAPAPLGVLPVCWVRHSTTSNLVTTQCHQSKKLSKHYCYCSFLSKHLPAPPQPQCNLSVNSPSALIH